jgi:hypothetical protein
VHFSAPHLGFETGSAVRGNRLPVSRDSAFYFALLSARVTDDHPQGDTDGNTEQNTDNVEVHASLQI